MTKQTASGSIRIVKKIKRRRVNAKSKTSVNKNSKNYKKPMKGQG